jgi:hypothetical protein
MKAGQALIDSTCELVVSNRRLLATSHVQIASSRRLLNPWGGISGGSEDDSLDAVASDLYDQVRARLHRQSLPSAPRLVFAGRATVQRACIVCRRRIRSGAMQHESVAEDGTKRWAHTLCLRIWVDATAGLRSGELPADADHNPARSPKRSR